jgi:SAM-dependent methyltransferase
MTDLHDMNPTGRFSDRADDYVKYRPSYPAAAIDAILDGLAIDAGDALRAADIGAGTGISARLLGDRGLTVIAVEPNGAMREAATPHPRVTWHDGSAEATGLGAQSVDLVVAAQAFHWFRSEDALREFARILRPRGRLALMWNVRNDEDPFTAAYWTAVLAGGGESVAARWTIEARAIADTALYAPMRRLAFSYEQRLDRVGLLGRARSATYVPKSGPLADKVIAELEHLYDRYADPNGIVTMIYRTEVYLAETRD